MVSKDFEELFACLTSHEVKALVIGGHAVAHHARPRFTKDIDLFVEPSEENAERLLQALEDFGFAGLGLEAADFSTPGKIIQLGYPPNRVDLATSITGVSFEEAWRGRVPGKFGAQTVSYIGRRELIRNKEASGRPQDVADLEWLRDED